MRAATETVDDARLRAAAGEPRNWLTHGGTCAEMRYSPLAAIHAGNVGQLGLAWFHDTRTNRGLEVTPIVGDGVMFATGSWSVVFALDAATGAVVWEKLTVDPTKPYTITGAPRVVKGKVLIGNGGAELGVRGYLSAHDAKTGELVWRFYTVPGDPSQPQESPALERALATWKGSSKGAEWWKVGGGGTCWDSMAYDPALDLLCVGTGNRSPWSRYVRSPGGGDDLYLSSILALRPDSGELVWHCQETPGDVDAILAYVTARAAAQGKTDAAKN